MPDDSTESPSDREDEELFLTALIYDSEEAAEYISEHTGVSLEKARSFVNACYEYELLLGIIPTYDDDNAREIALARVDHADLLPSGCEGMDYNLLRAYIERTTDLTSVEAVNMLAEDVGYYVKQGIMEPEAYEDTRAWADKIMIDISA